VIKTDWWIELQDGMVVPFVDHSVRYDHAKNRPVISYGLGSYGYDIRLSPKEFFVFKHIPGTVVNPKKFNRDNLVDVPVQCDDSGEFFVLPALSYGLGVSLEKLTMPPDVTAVCVGKSTYARCGVIANITPVEAGWTGHLTLEFSNSSSADVRLYAGEGVAQLLFFQGERCKTTYADRFGKYQNQQHEVTVAK
jgi:dCTP deaminase